MRAHGNYGCHIMLELIETNVFREWLEGLRDHQDRARIQVRMRRLSLGNPGDVKPVGEGISEMRIDYGPGYRAYFMRRGPVVVALLCGGDKRGARNGTLLWQKPLQRNGRSNDDGSAIQTLRHRELPQD
ncbi:MAG: type II toxin-antitoxin system RelE/ParE family toxin [Acidithiobacillus ferrooxidans]|jgi:putative addiction module killer protein